MFFVLLFSGIFPTIAVAYNFVIHQKQKSSRYRQFDVYKKKRNYFHQKYSFFVEMNESDSTSEIDWLTERYDTEHGAFTYFICLVPTVAIAIFGWSLFVWVLAVDIDVPNQNQIRKGLPFALGHDVTLAMTFGFLGALIFGFQLIYQRFSNQDLKPAIFLRVALALFAGMAFNFVLFLTVESFSEDLALTSSPDTATVSTGKESTSLAKQNGIGSVLSAIVAFSLGYFPSLAIRWFTRVSHSFLGEPTRRSDSQSLSVVDGISLFHEERLNEEGIFNMQDLAFADLGKLLVRTTFTAGQILDWVNQGKLYLYLGSGETDSFRRSGIRTASDLIDVWEPLRGEQASKEAERKEIAMMLQTTPERLDVVYGSLLSSGVVQQNVN